MNKIVTIVAVALLLAGCGAKSDGTASGDFIVAATFSPSPPTQGREMMTISLKDASGAPVKGATVSVSTTMPSMSMDGPTVNATDNGDGTYSASLLLNFATNWHFKISAKSGAKSGTTTLIQDVR